MRTISVVDIDKLYDDLLDYFGTTTVLLNSPHSQISHNFTIGAVAELDTLYELGKYQELCDLAIQEGFDITRYII